MMKYLVLLFSVVAFGGDNLNLSMPQSSQSYAQDRFRSGDFDCSQAIGSGSNFEFGVMGVMDDGSTDMSSNIISMNNGQTKNIGVYARMVVPINGPKSRINCNTLYQLELQKKVLEVQKLKAEVKQLQQLKFEDDVNNQGEFK